MIFLNPWYFVYCLTCPLESILAFANNADASNGRRIHMLNTFKYRKFLYRCFTSKNSLPPKYILTRQIKIEGGQRSPLHDIFKSDKLRNGESNFKIWRHHQ